MFPPLRFVLILAALLAAADSVAAARDAVPSPLRPFTVRAYEPYAPVGRGLTGYYLNLRDGDVFLEKAAPKGGELKLTVDSDSTAYLVRRLRPPRECAANRCTVAAADSAPCPSVQVTTARAAPARGAPLYLETADSRIRYYQPGVGQPPVGPLAVGWRHLASGTNVAGGPNGDGSRYPNSTLVMLGSFSNDAWFACPWSSRPPGEAYRMLKTLVPDGSDVNGCTAIILAAINA